MINVRCYNVIPPVTCEVEMEPSGAILEVIYSAFGKYLDPWIFPHFVKLQPYSKMDLKKTNSTAMYTQYPMMTKWKQVFRIFCIFIIFLKQKFLIYISIQLLRYDTQNWAQVHPVSIDHPWDASTIWLNSTCGKFNWLDMIWKGTHLSI